MYMLCWALISWWYCLGYRAWRHHHYLLIISITAFPSHRKNNASPSCPGQHSRRLHRPRPGRRPELRGGHCAAGPPGAMPSFLDFRVSQNRLPKFYFLTTVVYWQISTFCTPAKLNRCLRRWGVRYYMDPALRTARQFCQQVGFGV